METNWRLIIDGPLRGTENMARDALLLEQAENSAEPVTSLRFYRWTVPTLSLGRKQLPHLSADLDFCREKGIDVVHRPTGGGAVLHHRELTYSVVSNDYGRFGAGILPTYLAVARALQQGLQALGVPAEIDEKDPRSAFRPENFVKSPVPCFTSTSHYEITVEGRKILGSAQKRLKRAFLQHGSIPCAYDWPLQAGAMRWDAAFMQTVMSCVGDYAGAARAEEPSAAEAYFHRMEEAFGGAFARVFGAELRPGPFTAEELPAVAAKEGLFLAKADSHPAAHRV